MPTAFLFTAYFPQNSQKYLACWLTSIFLICFLKLAPYRVPYLPTMPAFFVLFVMAAEDPNHRSSRPPRQQLKEGEKCDLSAVLDLGFELLHKSSFTHSMLIRPLKAS
eukprot:c12766_g1_i1 orf=13-336(-)